jgi:hypothetical protein
MATGLHLSPLARHFIPKPLRQPLKQIYLQRKLDAVLARTARLSHGEAPSRGLLEELQDAWDNHGMAARTDYLIEVAREAQHTDGPVLECGSGLTTLLIGMLAGRRGIESWTLEHLPAWRDRVARVVARNDIPGTHLCLAPLRNFGGYVWYDAPLAQLPPAFRLVICDGPPGQTAGGRYGLFPVVGDRFGAGARILLDDVERVGERSVLRRWHEEAGVTTEIRDTPTGAFAVATVGAA